MPEKHYAQDLNLDRLDVYFNDKIDNSFYFEINMPEYISYGKNSFTIEQKQENLKTGYKLKNKSEILFEAYDVNGNIIFSDL